VNAIQDSKYYLEQQRVHNHVSESYLKCFLRSQQKRSCDWTNQSL